MSDEGGRIDIGKAPVEVLAALFRSIGAPVGEADNIARSIAEWRKPIAGARANAAAGSPDEAAKAAAAGQPSPIFVNSCKSRAWRRNGSPRLRR